MIRQAQADADVRGPSDREVVAQLRRLASARAHLLQAEQAQHRAEAAGPCDQVRNAEIEDAHSSVLWARAEVLTASRPGRAARAERALERASQDERRVLKRHGYHAFAAYLADRTMASPTAVALELAAREFAAAQAEWDAIGADPVVDLDAADRRSDPSAGAPPEARVVRDARGATVVIDLTGDNPRRIA